MPTQLPNWECFIVDGREVTGVLLANLVRQYFEGITGVMPIEVQGSRETVLTVLENQIDGAEREAQDLRVVRGMLPRSMSDEQEQAFFRLFLQGTR